jgi:hypothetical protein
MAADARMASAALRSAFFAAAFDPWFAAKGSAV